MKIQKKRELLNAIKAWANLNRSYIKEIVLIGSLANKPDDALIQEGSDIDIMLLVSETGPITTLQQSLSELSVRSERLIHPLFISNEERRLKLSISQYRVAYEKGERII